MPSCFLFGPVPLLETPSNCIKCGVIPSIFEVDFPADKRLPVIENYLLAIQELISDGSQFNQNYFLNPHKYSACFKFFGETHNDLLIQPDLSLPQMSGLYFLSQFFRENPIMQVADISEIRILDFASGLSGFPIYATEFGLVKAYDNYSQIPLNGIYNFHAACGHKNSLLIRKEEIHLFNPNIISVFGFWLSESWIYDLPSVQIIISDSLYNSGSIKGEGIFHYLGEKAQTPEDFGYRKVLQFPLVDIYVRLDTIKSNVGD